MLTEIGSVKNVPEFIKTVKAGERKMMGFGHRIYKSYDPRAKIVKRLAYEVFEVTGRNPLIDIALELEKIGLEDEYFVSHRLYPNVDFYTGIIYQAMGFPMTMFPVLFAIPRTSGWMAQWAEMVRDPEQKIARPRQIYLGEKIRQWTADREAARADHARGRGERPDSDLIDAAHRRSMIRNAGGAPPPAFFFADSRRALSVPSAGPRARGGEIFHPYAFSRIRAHFRAMDVTHSRPQHISNGAARSRFMAPRSRTPIFPPARRPSG